MKKYKYTIDGKLFDQDYDLVKEISEFASKLDVSTEIDKTKTGFTILATGLDENITKFEPQLFRKLVTFFSITKYTKKGLNAKIDKLKPTDNNINDSFMQKDIKLTAKLLRQSKVIAIKQDNGFQIICNASQVKAIGQLREVINQPDIPLPIVFRSIQKAKQQIILSKKESELLVTPEHPTIIAKLKALHRLEKPKYSLSPEINTLNQRVFISLKHGSFYKELFKLVDFPIVSIEAKDDNGTAISTKDELVEIYGDNFDSIFDLNIDIKNTRLRKTIQFVYGKEQIIQNNSCVAPKDLQEPTLDVCLDLVQSTLSHNGKNLFEFEKYKLLVNDEKMQEPKLTALSLIFSKLPIETTLGLHLPFTNDEINNLYIDWKNSENTIETNSIVSLFDAIASLSGELHKKSFKTQSVLMAESHFEVCEDGRFDYKIKDKTIKIDIISSFLQSNDPENLFCSLTNTISYILAQIAKEQNLAVNLCGELFQYRDLIELTIERLEEEEIKVYFR